ncbi:hypothetical protein RQ832_14970, partial [Roseomonas sp. DSM 102946]|nr:hypothetical protein [Roseomonas sp. DSM 102946]
MSGSTFWRSEDLGLDPRWYDSGQPARAPLGDVMSDAASEAAGFTSGLFGWMQRSVADRRAAIADDQANPDLSGGDRLLTSDEANQLYGIDGQLRFDRPLAESSARELRDIKQTDMGRRDRASRLDAGVLGQGAVMAAGLAGSMVDPLSVASAFIPAVGATRAAAWMARAGTRLERATVAARIGMLDGAAGAVALEPLQYGLAQAESRDYDLGDSLLNVAFGAVMGGLLHSGGRALVDGWRGWRPDVDPATVRDIHEIAMRTGAAQMARGEPVNVEPILAIARAADSRREGLLSGFSRIGTDAEGRPRLEQPGAALTSEAAAALPAASPDAPDPVAAREAMLREGVRGPVLDAEGQPVVALSRRQERQMSARLEREGHSAVEWVRMEGEPGAYAVSMVDGAEIYRAPGGEARVYPSATRAKTAASQIEGAGWAPVEIPDQGFVLMRAPGDAGQRIQANRRLLEMGDRFLSPEPAQPPAPDISPQQLRAMMESAAREVIRPDQMQHVTAARDARMREQAAGGRVETAVGKIEAQTAELDARAAQVDEVLQQQLKAGRITEADIAALRDPDTEARTAARADALQA